MYCVHVSDDCPQQSVHCSRSPPHLQIWDTLERDPLFARQDADLTLDQQRELTYRRVKRLYEYDFLPHSEIMENPTKFRTLLRVIQMYDMSLHAAYSLSRVVRSERKGEEEGRRRGRDFQSGVEGVLLPLLCCDPASLPITYLQVFTSAVQGSGTERHKQFAKDCIDMKVLCSGCPCGLICLYTSPCCLRCMAVLLSLRSLMAAMPEP